MSKIRITLAGATGWAGSALAKGIAKQEDLALVAALSRKSAGADLGTVLSDATISCPVFASAQEALKMPSDVESAWISLGGLSSLLWGRKHPLQLYNV